MDKLLTEEEYQTYLYKKKLEEYETGKTILKSLVSPELFGILEEYIEISNCRAKALPLHIWPQPYAQATLVQCSMRRRPS
ncbi:unnamed protein product [Parnassius mnemosyne]|uniref:Uncharacterized protein n=1 Tax=Parnassius mnemosyne TaxID=213953 RepID=A0AAV1LTL4_9NEOP